MYKEIVTSNFCFLFLKEQKQLEILECLRFGTKYKKYSPVIRLFCFTLHYYSPKAYEYIRSIFNSNLPASRTLRSWMSNIDSDPGFTKCAFDALKAKVDRAKESRKEVLCGLIFDEMSTRRHSQYDKTKKAFLGHITAGRPVEYDDFSPLAKEALLLMVSGINYEFKIPIAYFLTCGLCSEEKFAILNEAMHELSKTGVKLVSMTSDAHKSNMAVYKQLGANYVESKPYFNNPFDDKNKVHVILDPPHMIKLIRNCIARFNDKNQKFMDGQGNEICFQYIKDLLELQLSKNINLSNKVTKTHIEFHNIKMNVRIAAQTISNSSATAIEFLDIVMENEKFANSVGTTQFLRTFNSLFDIMNTKKGHTDDKFKRAICAENISEIKEKFNRDKEYIQGLTTVENGKRIAVLKTDSYTPFFGFLYNMTSFLGIYSDYVIAEFSGIQEFYTFSVSQDHVESTFGCIRQMGGNNCNPNAQQFGAAYRKLLFQNEVTTSDYSNCRNDVTRILEVSSGAKKVPTSADAIELQMLAAYNDEHTREQFGEETELNRHSKAFLGSELEQKVTRKITLRGRKACLNCLNILSINEKINNIFINFLSQMKRIEQPCKSTMYIIDVVDNILETYDSLDISYPSMLTYILNCLSQGPDELLYESSEFGKEHDHELDFLKLMVETYLDIKCTAVSKLVTRSSQKRLLRHHNLKEVHREGQ